MIWGFFVGIKLGPIVFLDGTVNSDIYIAVLHKNLLPYFDAITADSMSNIVFQQDNASPHVYPRKHAIGWKLQPTSMDFQ